MKVIYKPRNDFVLIRIIDKGETDSGIAVPDLAIEGKEFVVEAVGPKVEGLVEGDKVLMIGQPGVSFFPLPKRKDLLVLQQEFVVLVLETSEE